MAKVKRKTAPKMAAKQNANVGSGPKITNKTQIVKKKKKQ
jgi:hypothetical protein